MIKRTFKITSEAGVHARPATILVNTAMDFCCEITLTALKQTVDFKSIMGVMSLGVYKGTSIDIQCDGDDETQAMKAITERIYELNLGKEI